MFGHLAAFLCIVTLGADMYPAAAPSSLTDDVHAIITWEHDAVKADLAGDADFYARGLSEQWTDGMSDGTFQTKNMLLIDLRDSKRNITSEESLADMHVNVAGDVAVATYREAYDAIIHGKSVKKTIITTDTFLKRSGKWIQIAAHSSAVQKRTSANSKVVSTRFVMPRR